MKKTIVFSLILATLMVVGIAVGVAAQSAPTIELSPGKNPGEWTLIASAEANYAFAALVTDDQGQTYPVSLDWIGCVCGGPSGATITVQGGLKAIGYFYGSNDLLAPPGWHVEGKTMKMFVRDEVVPEPTPTPEPTVTAPEQELYLPLVKA